MLPNDAWGRSISMTTDGIEDTYTVAADSNGNPAFNLVFPAGSNQQNIVYPAINGCAPFGSGGSINVPGGGLVPILSFIGSGRTVDRPATGAGSIPNGGMVTGMTFLDVDLQQLITFVGVGSTGWVDGSGKQV
jgi:hypothetical protein